MAGEAIVGALRVVLGMDTASFEDGAKRASGAAESFGTKMAAVFAGVGLERIVERVFEKIVGGFKETIAHAFEFADNMGKMAQKVGISVEELTGLKLAADLSDVSMESLSTALGKLSKNMVAAGQGTKEAREQFGALGINVKDGSGNLKSATQVLGEMADKFEGTKDGATKVAAAMALLGKGGKDLIPLLNEGGASLKEFAQVAENMGLVVSTRTSGQVQKFNDDLKLLKLGMEGVGNLVVKELIPGLVQMSGEWAKNAKEGTAAQATAKAIASVFRELVVQIIITIETFRLLSEAFVIFKNSASIGVKEVGDAIQENLIDGVVRLGTIAAQKISDLIAPLFAIKEAAAPLPEEFGGIADVITTKIPPANAELMKIVPVLAQLSNVAQNARTIVPKMFEDAGAAAKKAKPDLEAAGGTGLSKELEKLALQTAILKNNFDNLAPGLPEIAARLGLIKENGSNLVNSVSLLNPQLLQLNTALLNLQAAKLNEEFLSPWDKFADKLKDINKLQDNVNVSQEALGEASKRAAGVMIDSYGQGAATITTNMSTAFKTLAEGNQKYAAAAKAAAIAEATVNTFVAASKAYAQLGIFGVPAAAAIVAAGLVNVAKISATQFATGGSFKVGGSGGIDSQLVQFKATPGEMVDVRKGENARTGGNGGSTQLVIPPIKPKDFFTGDTVREMLIAVDQWHRDGGSGMRFAT